MWISMLDLTPADEQRGDLIALVVGKTPAAFLSQRLPFLAMVVVGGTSLFFEELVDSLCECKVIQ